MIQRTSKEALLKLSKSFRAICVTGPRQSGKTTLIKKTFKGKPYVSLEEPEALAFATTKPKEFLAQYKKGAIIDEAQKVPKLFNYLQGVIDSSNEKGLFVLSGSNNFLLQQSITQSLAGRVAYLQLLPLSYEELYNYNSNSYTKEKLMLQGGYPELYASNVNAKQWYDNYIQTYIERDVRLIRNINNVQQFRNFIQYCAGLAGKQINYQKISSDLGIDIKTVKDWFSILEASYILYTLPPYYNNFLKRITKTSKLYFYDTGLLCNLLKINTITSLQESNLIGAVFENWVITELRKNKLNNAEIPDQYFFRDSVGNEIDLLQIINEEWCPIEIKYGGKFDTKMIKGIEWYQKLSRTFNGMVIYGGKESKQVHDTIWCNSWQEIKQIN